MSRGTPGPARLKPPSAARAFGCVLGVGLALLAAAGVGCARKTPPPPAAAQVLRLSQRNEPADLDPATTSLPDEFAILRALYEGLLIPAPDGGPPQPGAAARFEVSPDGLTYTFHLRPDAQWSDGAAVTAPQFVSAYQRLLTPATAAPKATAFYPVKNARAFVAGTLADFGAVGFRAPNPHTLIVTLEQPTPRFPYYVASGPWLPVRTEVVARHGRTWTRPEHFVGNGPFTLAEWRPDQRIVVQRNPRWHGAAGVRLGAIQFIRFDSGDSEERAYRAGQIDATMSVPFAKVEVYARERPAELHRAPMIETRYLSFNTRRPPLDRPQVRTALALAIDRAEIAKRVLRGGQPPTGRFLPPALRPPDGAPSPSEHRLDPAAARRALAAAGVAPKDFPRLELTAWSSSQVPVLEAVQAMWRQTLGIEVTLAVREARVHLDALVAGGYDIALVTAIPDVADAGEMLGDFVTGAAENYPHWSDAAFDALLAESRGTRDAGARTATLLRAETTLLAAAPLSPLYFNPKIWLMSPRVHGWQEDGLWARCYHTVYLDEN